MAAGRRVGSWVGSTKGGWGGLDMAGWGHVGLWQDVRQKGGVWLDLRVGGAEEG